eukprot:332256_1
MTSRTNNIGKKIKQLIFGYIHNMETLYSKVVIPEEIVFICICYFGNGDEWDDKWIGPHMTLDIHTHTVTQTKTSAYESAFLKTIVDSGYHEWTFKIEKFVEHHSFMMIGLWKVQQTPPISDYFTADGPNGYAYCTGHAKLSNPITGNTDWNQYGIVCQSGTIVTMILDFDKATLSYIINGENAGKAFDIEPFQRYKAAVYMIYNGDSIRFIEKL